MTALNKATAMHENALASAERLRALRESRLMDSLPEPHFDRVTRLIARLLDVPIALLSLVDEERQFFKSACGLPEPVASERQTPLSHSFCQHVVTSDDILIVENARTDPRLDGNLAISDLDVISYLGVPVRGENDEVLGSLCAIGNEPRQWSQDQIDTLVDLRDVVETELRLRDMVRIADRYANVNSVLAREYQHRVKNALAVASSIVNISGREGETIEEVVDKSRDRINALAKAHDILIEETNSVALRDLAEQLLEPYGLTGGMAQFEGPDLELLRDQMTSVCFFIHELATNSVKYGAFAGQRPVRISWSVDGGNAAIEWQERAEQKGAPETGGFGSKLLDIAALQLNGVIERDWVDDELTVTLRFPYMPGSR